MTLQQAALLTWVLILPACRETELRDRRLDLASVPGEVVLAVAEYLSHGRDAADPILIVVMELGPVRRDCLPTAFRCRDAVDTLSTVPAEWSALFERRGLRVATDADVVERRALYLIVDSARISDRASYRLFVGGGSAFGGFTASYTVACDSTCKVLEEVLDSHVDYNLGVAAQVRMIRSGLAVPNSDPPTSRR